MCNHCSEIDARIAHLLDIARRMQDQQILDGIASLVAELEAKKAALHPE